MIRKTNRETLLERRITRLENMIRANNSRQCRSYKNETYMIGDDYKEGARVMDADSEEGTIVDVGTLAGLWRNWSAKIDNRDEVRSIIDEDDNAWQAYTVVVEYDNGYLAMVPWPDEGLDLI